jgi:hypothetical protein
MQSALKILDRLITSKPRSHRITEFLRNPSAKETPDWYMCIPDYFNMALDIKITDRTINKITIPTLTQGSNFNFCQGDVIYEKPKSYLVWSEEIKRIRFSIQIDYAVSASSATTKTDEKGNKIIIPRKPGNIHFSIYRPNIDKTRILKFSEYQLTQDDFLRFLIAGPDPILQSIIKEGLCSKP